VGPYEITVTIGAGGMGQVYRARDTKLIRDVALKTLPEPFARDDERLLRFKREAQVLASLNHPNIAAIYGFEDADGAHALILELVDGPTLADRIAEGAIPVDEALPIARQIAEALEAAHEQGVVHRDLKPANIKLTAEGAVKVLDFGLAKAFAPARDAAAHLYPSVGGGDANGVGFALSPDGRSIVYRATTEQTTQLWRRTLNAETARPLAGTENGGFPSGLPMDNQSAFLPTRN
jgi:serine/threonine-protein kinase